VLTWSCPACQHSNTDTGTCAECGRVATKGELRHAKRIARTKRYFPRGLPLQSSSGEWARPLRPVAVLSALAILLQFLPGLLTAAPDLTTVPTIAPVVGNDNLLAGVRIFQPEQPTGMLGVLSPPATSRLYLTVPQGVPPEAGPTQVIVDGDQMTVGQLPDRALQYVTTVTDTGIPAGTTASSVRQRQGNAIYTLPVANEGPAQSWALAGVNYRVPGDGLLPLPQVPTLLKSGQWSAGWISLIGLALAFVGFALGNRDAARRLIGPATALLTFVLLSGPAAGYLIGILGRRASQPDYAMALAIGVPILIVVAIAVIAITAGRLAKRGLDLLAPHEETSRKSQETYYGWLIDKATVAVALPLILGLTLLALDFTVWAIAPGLTL
jgi:hypothetical protein